MWDGLQVIQAELLEVFGSAVVGFSLMLLVTVGIVETIVKIVLRFCLKGLHGLDDLLKKKLPLLGRFVVVEEDLSIGSLLEVLGHILIILWMIFVLRI